MGHARNLRLDARAAGVRARVARGHDLVNELRLDSCANLLL